MIAAAERSAAFCESGANLRVSDKITPQVQ
jgi:hypothetical protein